VWDHVLDEPLRMVKAVLHEPCVGACVCVCVCVAHGGDCQLGTTTTNCICTQDNSPGADPDAAIAGDRYHGHDDCHQTNMDTMHSLPQ